jgi:hypothetical protein
MDKKDNKCYICGDEPFVTKMVAVGFIPVCRKCFSELEPLLDRLREKYEPTKI